MLTFSIICYFLASIGAGLATYDTTPKNYPNSTKNVGAIVAGLVWPLVVMYIVVKRFSDVFYIS